MSFDFNRLRVDQLERLLEVNGDFNALSEDELEELLESQEEFSSFGAGLQEFYGSSVEGIGAALGIDAIRDYGRREVEETQIRFNPDVPSITKAFEEGIGTGIASIPEFTLEQTLRSLPQLAFQAGAGLLATRFGGPKAGAAAFTAAGVPAYTGRNIERQVEEQGISIEDADVVKAIGVGALQSGLDVFLGRTLGVFGQQQGMKKILDSASKHLREDGLKKAKVLGPLGTAFGVGAAIEAPTEAAQQALEIMQSQPEGTDLVEYFSNLSPEIQNELLESAVAGGLVGGSLQTTVTGVGTVAEARAQAKQEKEQAEAEELAGQKEEFIKDLQDHLKEESQDTIAMEQLVRRFEESRLQIPVDPMYEFRAAAKAKQDASDEVFLGEDETVLKGLRRLDLERRQLNQLTGPAREEKAKQLVKRQAQLERAALARAKKAEKVADRRETAEIERLIQDADNDRFLQTYKEIKRQEQDLINKAVERVERQAIKPTSDQETLEGRERTLALEQEQALREGILQNILETSSDKLEQYYSGGITKIFQTLLRAAGQPASITDREAQMIARAEGLKSPAMIDTRTPQQIQKAKDLEQKKTVDIIAEARDERPNQELDALLESLGIDPETLNPVSQEVSNRLLEQELRSQGVTTTDPFLPPKQRREKKAKPVPLRIKNNRLFSRAVTGADLQSLRLLDQLSRRQSNQRSKRIRDKIRFPAFNQPTIKTFNDNIDLIFRNLRYELDRLGLADVKLEKRDIIRDQDALAEGFAEPTNQSANQKYLIALATEIYSPNLKREQLQKRIEGIMHHEVIHALRGLGVFTEAEFDTLVDAAKKTKYVDKTGRVRKFTYFDRAAAIYKNDGAEVIKEEAVAELFKDFMSGRTKLEAKKVKNAPSLFQRIITYFKGLIGGLEKSGITETDDVFARPEEIFEKIKTGEIGARDRRLDRSLDTSQMQSRRATEDSPAFYNATDKQIEQLLRRYDYNDGTSGYAVRMPVEDFMTLTYGMGKVNKQDVDRVAKSFLERTPAMGSAMVSEEDLDPDAVIQPREAFTRFDPDKIDSQNYMGVPYLEIQFDEAVGDLKVYGHEGRHRTALAAIDGADTVPVHIEYKQFYTNYDYKKRVGEIPRDQEMDYKEFAKGRNVVQEYYNNPRVPVDGPADIDPFGADLPQGVPIYYKFKDELNKLIGPESDPLPSQPVSTESATELLNAKPNDQAGTKKLSKRMTLDEWLQNSAIKDPVYHATFTSFSAFDPQVTEDNAIHFAPEEDTGIARLEEVARFQQEKFEDEVVMFPRMIEARIQIEKPLRLPFDLGNWGDDALWRIAFDEGKFMFKQGQSLTKIKYQIDTDPDIQTAKEAIQKAREQDGVTTFNLEPDDIWMALEGAGFDGIIYANEGEGFGSESYLVWNPQQIYVENVEPVQYGDLEYAYTYDDPKDSMTKEEIDAVSYRPIVGIQAPIDQSAIDTGTVRERLEMFKYGVKGSTPLPSPTALQRFDRLGDPLPTLDKTKQEKTLDQMGFSSPSEYIAYLDQRLDDMMEVQPDKKLSKRVSGISSAEENVLGVDLDRTIINVYPEEYIKPNGEKGFRLTGDKQYKPNSVTLLDAAKTLHKMSSEAVGSKETLEYTDENAEVISDLMTTEALKALSEDNNNIGWYDAQIKAAKKILRMIEPRIFESPESETIFDWVLAVTSNGQAVSQNLKQSVDVFRFYLDNQGRLPVEEFKQGGERQADMQAAFFFANEYNKALADGSIDVPLKEFLSTEFTVRDLQQEIRDLNEKFGTDIRLSGDENVDTIVFGSFVAGAKIGQGFYQNIVGNYEPLTMDIWWMRMWNRLVNREPQVADKKVVRERRDKARKEILELAKTDDFIRVILGIDKFTFPNSNQEFKGAFPATGLNRTDLRNNTTFDEFVPAFNRAYQRYFTGYKKAYGQNPVGKPQIVKDMKTLEGKIYGSLQATPASGSERQYMRQVTKRTQQKLSDLGVDIEIADLQALLWYPEKRLFEALGVRKGQGQDTDYKESATELAQEKQYGDFTQEQIEEALADTRTESITSGRDTEGSDGRLYSVSREKGKTKTSAGRKLSARPLAQEVDTTYRMAHQPRPDGARLDDMTGGGEYFPSDIYTDGLRLYGNPRSEADRESYAQILEARGNPEKEVTIYRAVPNDESITTINAGDFVTLSRAYAEMHGASGYGRDGTDAGKILSKTVKVKDLLSDGNDLNEFGYFPDYTSSTTKPKRQYSTRYSLTAGTKEVDLDELIDRLVQPKPKEQSEIMNVVGKLIGQVEGESLYQAFIRNIVNRFAPGYLLDDYLAQAQGKKFTDPAESVGRQMELSQSVTGRIWCLSQLGAVRFNKETGDAEQIEAGQTMGLDKIFEPIGSRYKREFSAYAYARRELRMRQKQGRRGFIAEDNDDLIKLVRNSEAKYPFFEQVHKNYQNFNDQMIQFAKDSGLISEEQADNFAEMDYVPFYAYFAPPEGQSEFSKSMSAKAQAALKDPNVFEKELVGRTIPVGDLYENVTQNAAAIVTAGLKNNAMQKCANALEQSQQIVGGLKDWGRRVTPDDKGLKNVITFYQNGEKVQYVIKDAPLWNALSGLTAKQKEGFVKFGAIASNLLRSGVTLIPGFQLANLYRGKIDAFVKLGPERDEYSFQNTFNSLKGTAKALKDVYTNDPDVSKFKLISGFGGYYYGADPETFGVNIERRYRFKEGNYDKGYKGFFRRTGDSLLAARDALERTGEASEMAERIVIMRKFMERGMSEKEAVFQGLNLINFGRRGAGGGGLGSVLVNYLIPLIPFLNARIQGLYKLAEDPNQPMTVRKAALISMYKRAGLVTLGSTANALFQMTGDEEERWENETITEKVTNDIVYIGDYKLRIPRAFEIGSVFGAIPVMTMDAIRQKDGSDLASTFGFIFNQTFGVNLVPQAVLPIAEVAFNYDTFRKSPIEGFGVSGMPTEYRAYDSTPEFYKALSQGGLSYVGLSPLELQQLFEGYTGTFGAAFIATLDNLIGMTGVIPEKPEGAFGNAFIDIPTKISGLDRFIREDGTGASRFVNDFYETKRDIDQTYRAIKLLADGEQAEAINELMESKGAALGYRNLFNNIARSITKINKAREMIRRDPNMSSSEKKERLLALNKQRIELSRRAMKMAEDSGYFE